MYRLSRPAGALAPHIEHYWHVRAPAGSDFDLTVDVYVDARADLIFNFGAPYTRTLVGARGRRIGHSNLDAQRLKPIRIRQRGDVEVCGVRFRTAGLMPFVSHDVAAWCGKVVPLASALGPEALLLERALRAAGASIDEQAKLLDTFFLARLDLSATKRAVHRVKSEIEAHGGELTVGALCELAQTSARNLDRLFRRHMGFGPKTFSRVVRFQRALNRVKTDLSGTLAGVAAECGYYDQSHLVREFKLFAGTAPKHKAGYFPADAPVDFSPNLVRFVQDARSK